MTAASSIGISRGSWFRQETLLEQEKEGRASGALHSQMKSGRLSRLDYFSASGYDPPIFW
jgi:hypothetical protein